MEKWNPGGRKRPTLLLETRKHDLFPEKIIPPFTEEIKYLYESILDYNFGIDNICSSDYTNFICTGAFLPKKGKNICQRKTQGYFPAFFL